MLDDKSLRECPRNSQSDGKGYFDRFILCLARNMIGRIATLKLGVSALPFDAYPALRKFFLLICDKI